jgi:glucokinase
VDSAFTLGIDLGGTSIRVGLYGVDAETGALTLVKAQSLPTRVAAGPAAAVAEMASAVRALLELLPVGARVLGLGIGSPGPLNLRTGTLGVLPNLPGWEGFPLRDALAEATGLLVTLESDANAAALAEWKLGAGRALGLDSLAMITLGTGVGSGLILHGRVWQGILGMGGELGHASIHPDGPACPCGSRGCLEWYASANGLIRLAREVGTEAGATAELRALTVGSFMPLDVARLAESGDAGATEAFARLGHHLGLGLAALTNTLDLPLLIIGGGLAAAWPLFERTMFATLRGYSQVYRLSAPTQTETMEADRTFVCAATLGASAGLLGAALLPMLDAARN